MKKCLFTIFIFFICTEFVLAGNKISVKFSSCVDGDTAKFEYKNKIITARFLAIDTPETKHPTKGIEPFGKEASEYTCDKITNAKKIELEYDDNSDKQDKYSRELIWVFVDNNLLQKELVEKGYARVAYLYGDYKYTSILENEQKIAKNKKIGIWSIDTKKKDSTYYINEYKEYIILIGIIIILCIFNKKYRKQLKNTTTRRINKELKKRLK